MQCTYKRNNEACLCNQCCSGIGVRITYYECVYVALVIQYALRHIRPAQLYSVFSTLSQKWYDFRKKKKVPEHKMYGLVSFTTFFFWNISHSKKNWERYDQKLYIGLHVKYRLFLSEFNETCIFSTVFRKIYKYQISLTLRWLMSYIYGAPILDLSRSHTTTQHSR